MITKDNLLLVEWEEVKGTVERGWLLDGIFIPNWGSHAIVARGDGSVTPVCIPYLKVLNLPPLPEKENTQ